MIKNKVMIIEVGATGKPKSLVVGSLVRWNEIKLLAHGRGVKKYGKKK